MGGTFSYMSRLTSGAGDFGDGDSQDRTTWTKEGCMMAWVIGGAVGGGGKRYGKGRSSGCGVKLCILLGWQESVLGLARDLVSLMLMRAERHVYVIHSRKSQRTVCTP